MAPGMRERRRPIAGAAAGTYAVVASAEGDDDSAGASAPVLVQVGERRRPRAGRTPAAATPIPGRRLRPGRTRARRPAPRRPSPALRRRRPAPRRAGRGRRRIPRPASRPPAPRAAARAARSAGAAARGPAGRGRARRRDAPAAGEEPACGARGPRGPRRQGSRPHVPARRAGGMRPRRAGRVPRAAQAAAMKLEELIFDVAEALRIPVLVLVVAALAAVLVELGAFVVELLRRRRRDTARLERAATSAREALARGDLPAAQGLLWQVACSTAMATTLAVIAGARERRARGGPRGQGARRLRLRLAAPAGAHPAAGPRRPGARADGHADPALPGARRARRGQRHRAEREPAPGLQHHRARPAGRADRLRDLARPRPPLRAGPLRPRVRGGDAARGAT